MKPEVFFTHNGITIYRVHKLGFGEGRATDYWYSTAGDIGNHERCKFYLLNHGFPLINPNLYTDSRGLPRDGWYSEWQEKAKYFITLLIDAQRLTLP